MNERKSKNIVIVALCITLIFMGVGFSLLSQQLTINGSASVDSGSRWDIEIDSITPVKAVYGGSEVTTNLVSLFGATPDSNNSGAIPQNAYGTIEIDSTTKTEGAFQVNFLQPGDYVIYEITTGNHGTLDAVLASAAISTVDTSNNNADTSPNYTAQQDANESEIYGYAFGTLSGSTWTESQTPTAIASGNYSLAQGNYVGNPNNQQATGNVFYVKVQYNDTEVNPGDLTSAQKTSSATVTFTYNQTQNS